jgi:beta-D-xylosidase 4
MTLAYRLGYFDPPESQPYRQLTWSDVNKPDAQALAHTAAVEGLVLLKNDGFLPVSPKGKTVAIIGPYTNATRDMQGNYFGTAPFIVTPLQGAMNVGFDKVVSAAGTSISGTSDAGFAAAISAAKSSDIIIFAGGINNGIEAEARDRLTIAWTGNQLDLVKQLASLGKPVIVVQFGGGQLDDTDLLENDAVSHLLQE